MKNPSAFKNIDGIMIESNIKSGNQTISNNLEYGISITDKCLDLNDTYDILLKLNDAFKLNIE